MSIILRTLDRYINTNVEYQKDAPWDVIGFACLNDGLYKEAEHIYDEICRRAHGRENISHRLIYCRAIAKFLQGKFRGSYEDFKLSRHYSHLHKQVDIGTIKAISYMEDTIFPMIEKIVKTKEKLRSDLGIPRFVEKAVGPNILKTLHKWNSSSPLFSSNISQGGGYLLTLKNHLGAVKAIAIDPGYGFIDIFRDIDLSIIDLDGIIITHDHDDHTESMESILSLLAKYNDNVPHNKIHHLDVFGSAGVMLKYQGLFNALDPLGSKEINFRLMTPGSTIEHVDHTSLAEKYGCVIHVKQAFHEELWTHQESAVGVVIETSIMDKNDRTIRIGITGDTRYESGLGEQYQDCQVLLFNIGSLEKEEGKLLTQHLGLIGSINLLKEARPHLAVVTEFGEEFRGKRVTVSSVIEEWAKPMEGLTPDNDFKVIPADIDLEVRLNDLYIKETSSKVFLPHKTVEADETESDSIIYRMKEK
ncbi:MAG: MBL fold metallo-hydrolase [Candidatus Margulisiibacteriota bacterium]